MKKPLIIVLVLFLLFGAAAPSTVFAENTQPVWQVVPSAVNKIDPSLKEKMESLQADEPITVIVQLKQRAILPDGRGAERGERIKRVVDSLQQTANDTQGPVRFFLRLRKRQGTVKDFTPLWILNGFSVTANASAINEISKLPDVLSITPDAIDIVPVSDNQTLSNPEQNISLISAPLLWNMGYTGEGIVMATMDSGVDLNHPELSGRWRGGTNSWYDPFGQHAIPFDASGHGTWTMGVMVGSDLGGTSIGVAPNAQWIAVKIFNDQGTSTATAIHLGYQWLLNPDNDPATDDAPQVVNNSWAYGAPGCNLEFEPDLQSLRAAGILPVFAAGNYGPNVGTSNSPANNPSAFAVGAINNNSLIYGLSSRGPTTCGGSTGVFPELVAPGVNIYSTDLGGFYTTSSGTSMSAPHVSAGLALLLSAYPNLSAAQQEAALTFSAADLGASGPDDIYGNGRMDLFSAFQWLANMPTETPAPTATLTLIAVDTETPTSLPTATLEPPQTATATGLPTFTVTPIPSSTPTTQPTFTSTTIPSNTPTSLPTFTATSTPTKTATTQATFTRTPTATRTSTATRTPTPTKTPLPLFHIGDLDQTATQTSSTSWTATVTIYAHNASETPLSGVKVNIKWTGGATGTTSCTTNSSGFCRVSKSLSTSKTSITLTVTGATKSSYTYKSANNHDVDGGSTGTIITVSKP